MSTVSMPVRVILVDDHAMIREGLRVALEQNTQFQIVGEAKDGVEALALAEQLSPDMMTVDIEMPRMNGVELIKELHHGHPGIRVLVLSMLNNPYVVNDALKNGARGYVPKDEKTCDIVHAVELATRGVIYISPSINMPTPSPNCLTEREREVITLVAQGMTSREIASQFNRSVRAIDAHRANIAKKLETDSVADWTRYVIRRGWCEGYRYSGPEQE